MMKSPARARFSGTRFSGKTLNAFKASLLSGSMLIFALGAAFGFVALTGFSLGGKTADAAHYALDPNSIEARCAPASPSEEVLESDAFHWHMTLDQMQAKWEEVYASPKRLFNRAYFDARQGTYILPYREFNGGDVVLSKRLIESVRRHIEESLRLGYVQYVFFPDMGHSHLFIPQEVWNEEYTGFGPQRFSQLYTKLFNDPELKVLYHTAEQLGFLDENNKPRAENRQLLWRMATRNPVGDNRGLGHMELLHNFKSSANTAGDYPGHRYFGAGFSVSANENGCFPYEYQGKTYYFDLSLFDLPHKP